MFARAISNEPAAAADTSRFGRSGEAGPRVDGIPPAQRVLAVSAITLALGMAFLDGAIANVALPTIARDLQVSAAGSIWVVNAYQLAVTTLVLACASLGEVVGLRLVFLSGIVVFVLASAACTTAYSLPALIIARSLQGVGAACIMSVSLALLRGIYPQRLIGRGVGISATVGPAAAAIGPTVASVILGFASWPWLFVINIPLGVLALVIAARSLPKSQPKHQNFDAMSALLNVVTFGLFVVGLDEIGAGGREAFGSVALAISLGSGFLLVRRQTTRPAPLLPVDLLKIPIFALSAGSAFCAFTAQGLAYVSLPFYFREILGESLVMTGLLMTPWPLAVAIAAPLSGRAADRYSPAILAACGLAALAVGLGSLALLPLHPRSVDVAWRMMLCGLGFGLFNAPNNRLMMVSIPQARSGGASGMVVMSRVLGQTTGATLVAVIYEILSVKGTTVALATATVAAVVGVVFSLCRRTELSRQPKATVPD